MRPIDYFDTAAEMFPSSPALIGCDGTTLSFAELTGLSHRIAGALTAITEAQPLPVAIFSPNDHQVIALTLGAMRAGAVVMSVHVKASTERNIRYFEDVSPCCVFYHAAVADEVRAIRAGLRLDTLWISFGGACGDDLSLEAFLESGCEFVDEWGDIFGNPTRPWSVRQTSGTTGTPKLIVGDIGSYGATQMALQHKLRVDDSRPVCLVPTPLSHAAGLHAFVMATLGATLVIMRDFETADVLKNIERFRITHIWLPPSALYMVLGSPHLARTDCSSLRSVLVGASAVSPAKLKEAVQAFGPCVAVNYAQIEGGFLTWLDADVVAAAAVGSHPERLMSSGRSMFVSRLAVMDEEGQLLPRGQIGEVVVRGRTVKPYMVKPYVEDVAELSESQKYGWHHTGDLGYIDECAYLYVTGRKKDMVITAGFKVSAAEVERVIMELPEIAECAVIAVPDERRGEVVTAIVTTRGGRTLDEKTVLAHCRERLGRLQSPATVEHWTDLPKSAVGKVDKKVIRERFWANAERQVN